MDPRIKKAKIKNFLFLDVEYSEQIADGTAIVKKDCTAPVHDDLKLAFKKLNIHLALLCEQTHVATGKPALLIHEAFPDEEVAHSLDPDGEFKFTAGGWELVRKIQCTGFSIGGSGDSEGITLTGSRELKDGRVLNLTSPFYKWEDDYSYISELGEIIEECKSEVHQYLFEGKHQPDAQLDLFEEQMEDELSK